MFVAVATVGGLSLLLASLLVLANHWLYVEEDPRIDDVEGMLPHTNCGGCGYPGCRPFAEALISGETQPGSCTVCTSEEKLRIADYLGVALGEQQCRVARLACAGGSNVARNRAHYVGSPSCAAATLVGGGGKGCFWGCLGLADCDRACGFDAIHMDEHHLPVVNEQRCTACGDCVTACPKDLFSLRPRDNRLWVACRSLEAGEEVLADCEVACTACERCAHDSPQLIQMANNLPVIDYSKRLTDAAIQSCPTGAIVWLDERQGAVKGRAAHKVIRNDDLRDGPT